MPFDKTRFAPEMWKQLILSRHKQVDLFENGAIGLDPEWMTEAEQQALQPARPLLRLVLDKFDAPPMLVPRGDPTTPSIVLLMTI